MKDNKYGQRYHFGLWLVIFASWTLASAGADTLSEGFQNPSREARPWVYWFIMDGNLSREGITADFEAMKRAGIGGVILMEVDAGIPRGPVEFMSAEWQALFRHAVTEAERLGLQITLNAGPGLDGQRRAVGEAGAIHAAPGGQRDQGQRARAFRRGPAPARSRGKPSSARARCRRNWRRPARSLPRCARCWRFRRPQADHRIADIDEKALVRAGALFLAAGREAVPAVRRPSIPPCRRTQCIAADQHGGPYREAMRRWASGLGCAGRATGRSCGSAAPAPAQNTRPGPGCRAWAWNATSSTRPRWTRTSRRSSAALLQRIGPRRTAADAGWTMLHIDSWEMGAQNWTGRLPRGIPAPPRLRPAALSAGDDRPRGGQPRSIGAIPVGPAPDRAGAGHRESRRASQEAGPPARFRAFHRAVRHESLRRPERWAAWPMCRCASSGPRLRIRHGLQRFEAASIAHTCGRPIVAAESFTADDSERWRLYPGVDEGPGRLGLLRRHQPDRVPSLPASAVAGPPARDDDGAVRRALGTDADLVGHGAGAITSTWRAASSCCGGACRWRTSATWRRKARRMCSAPPDSATRGNPPDRLGYNFDGCAPETLIERMSVKDGRLVLPRRHELSAAGPAGRETMTPALLRKIRRLVKAARPWSATPSGSPSLANYPECDAEVRRAAPELWGPAMDGAASDRTERKVGKGRILRLGNAKGVGENGAEIYREYGPVA